ncbi:hypothetical protein [Spirosoma areae]
MHKLLIIFVIILGASAAFAGYFAGLLDWIQDFSSGLYSAHPIEATLETSALLTYTYFGVKFFNRHFSSIR